jgi:hypothetical protein
MPSPDRTLWPESLRSIAPWIVATVACLLASIILSNFIATLHLSIERGEKLRATLAGAETATAMAGAREPGAGRQLHAVRQ